MQHSSITRRCTYGIKRAAAAELNDALLVVKFAVQGLAMWSVRLVTGSLPARSGKQRSHHPMSVVLLAMRHFCKLTMRRTCRNVLSSKPEEGQHRQPAVLQLLQLVLLELRAV